jgi:AAA15 family ATPase/GTPase
MINCISIKNFRCYKDTTIKGFKRLNLIGGLNNVGKTILLEALFLNLSPTAQNVITLKQLRGEDADTKEYPEYAWDNFFLNQDKNNEIYITTENNNGKEITLSIDCDEKIDVLNENAEENRQLLLNDFAENELILKSVLHLNYIVNNKKASIANLIAHRKGFNIREISVPTTINANYIPAIWKRKPSSLAMDYSVAKKRGRKNDVLESLKIIDDKIEDLDVTVVNGAHIEIKRKAENFMPASLFGDAINKILDISLNLINNLSSVILIDEIENGIHHTVQRDFWRFLFILAEKSDVQIFATTHSLEMLKAFADVSKDFSDNGAYFELFRRKSTNEIDFNLHDLDTLNYELSNEIAVRGE